MFFVYKSNNMNVLLLKASQIIQKQPLPNLFEKEIFIHDSEILFQYLNIFLAQKTGISANLKFYHPDDFIWKLSENILFKKKIKNLFTSPIMTWKIMKILDEKNFFTNFNKKNTIKKFKFSFLMSNILKKYIFYRPNWINSWDTGKNISKIHHSQKWQIKLWMEIINDTKQYNQDIYHFSNIFKSFNDFFKEAKINNIYFPYRLFLISSFSLNPSYIKIFKKISLYINVYFLYITPYKNNIFTDIEIIKSISKKKITKKRTVNDSLIKLWGQYEKIYEMYIIQSPKIEILNYFKKNDSDNLLNNIKNNFFNKKTSILNPKKKLLSSTDDSISINICYNKKNEIEILYEKLLYFLKQNPSITPGDIVVTSTSIDTYTSYIYSIFTAIDTKKQIPFFISGNFNKTTEIIVLSFKKIFNLPNSRFENKEILEFLDIPAIANKFNISNEEINIIYSWIKETNIRWAIDENHKDDLSFPRHKQNTWLYGIEKLLLSYAMNNTTNIWNNILSSSIINGCRAELISKLIIFINTLKKWKKKLSKSKKIKYWISLSNDIINDFFYYTENTEKFFEIIKKKWMATVNDNILSNYKKNVSIDILIVLFFNKLNTIKNKKFLPGVINFCHPRTVCYIPFKIICIIGADHDSFQKDNQLDDFNLLKKYPLLEDSSDYKKSCYIFFQSISCAQKKFYISYVGYSIKDESKIHPSILVDQLLNYIALNFFLIKDEHLNFINNKKTIIKHICKIYKIQHFYKIKKINNIKQELQYKYKCIKIKTDSRYHVYSNDDNKINLKNLIIFWRNPIRYFFNFHLNIKFNLKQNIIQKTEPFSVNKLDAFKIKSLLLEKIIHNHDTNQFFKYYVASGKLPYGIFGKIFWAKSMEEMRSIAKLIIKYRIETKTNKINLKIKKYCINGILSEVQDTGLLRWKPNMINYSDRISLWLEHLIYCILGGTGESKIIGYKKTIWSFSSLNSDMASYYLLKYIEGYKKGIKKIILLTKSGASWLDAVYDIKNDMIKEDLFEIKKGNKKLFQTWMGNNFSPGEKNDFYIQKTFTTLNKNNIKAICKTAKTWLLPILKYKKK